MMKQIAIIVLVALLSTVLLGCGNHEEPIATEQSNTNVALTQQNIQQNEINDTQLPTARIDLYSDGFEPSALQVTKGQKVLVTSYMEGEEHFSVAELGVEEPIKKGATVLFTASRTGDFEFACETCTPAYFGTLSVSE